MKFGVLPKHHGCHHTMHHEEGPYFSFTSPLCTSIPLMKFGVLPKHHDCNHTMHHEHRIACDHTMHHEEGFARLIVLIVVLVSRHNGNGKMRAVE